MLDFKKPFLLAVDASDFGVGAVLLQEDQEKIEHPISYFSCKLDKHHRNYSNCEKETLAIVLALQHFDFYLRVAMFPIVLALQYFDFYLRVAMFPIQVYMDHNPLC